MKELKDFKSMEELIQYKRELETRISDNDILEEVLDNIWSELLNVNMLEKSILSIKMTNKKWLATILMLLNSRDNSKSSVKVINDSKKQKKIYRLDSSLNQARIDEYNMDKEHNIVEIVDGTGVGYIYDSFSGEFILEKYLEEEKSFEEIEKLFDTNLFTGKEKRVLNKYVFDKSFEEEKDKKIRIRK